MNILESNVTISTPADLVAVLQQVKTHITRGRLRQLTVGDPSSPAMSDLPEAGPWPDLIDMSFEDNAGRRYRLVAETYHGRGGSWTASASCG